MTDHCYKYPRPALSADSVVFMDEGGIVKVLLIKRKDDPYQGKWAIPGGFMDMDETTEQAAHRELHEETGLTGVVLTRVDVFDAVDRDPRGRTITVVYTGFIEPERGALAKAGDDAAAIHWFAIDQLPELAFDHAIILSAARRALNL